MWVTMHKLFNMSIISSFYPYRFFEASIWILWKLQLIIWSYMHVWLVCYHTTNREWWRFCHWIKPLIVFLIGSRKSKYRINHGLLDSHNASHYPLRWVVTNIPPTKSAIQQTLVRGHLSFSVGFSTHKKVDKCLPSHDNNACVTR